MQFTDMFSLENGLRQEFNIPLHHGKEVSYMCGNSLGLQPKKVKEAVEAVMTDWETLAVEGHFYAKNPWWTYHKLLEGPMGKVVGALPHEVVVMNNLTSNLHFMLASFYKPQGKRTKIVMEAGAFPSDQYAVETHLRWHGLDPDVNIIELKPNPGTLVLETSDIVDTIRQNGNEIALVMLGGINYYTGQVFDMKTITAAGHEVGAMVGWDLAHAAGNVKLNLHDWNADFAVWCTYKYMNSGPGSIAGAFVHERHGLNPETPRLAGWWGYKQDTRFKMTKGFVPQPGAEGWQVANGTIIGLACVKASLDLFDAVGMDALLERSTYLTNYLEEQLRPLKAKGVNIITPLHAKGCQLSIELPGGRKTFETLMENGVICDWREPAVTRLAPTPMYNTRADIDYAVQVLDKAIS